MVPHYLPRWDLEEIEGQWFTLRAQKNSWDSVRITDEFALPKRCCRMEAGFRERFGAKAVQSSIKEAQLDDDAIKEAVDNTIVRARMCDGDRT